MNDNHKNAVCFRGPDGGVVRGLRQPPRRAACLYDNSTNNNDIPNRLNNDIHSNTSNKHK